MIQGWMCGIIAKYLICQPVHDIKYIREEPDIEIWKSIPCKVKLDIDNETDINFTTPQCYFICEISFLDEITNILFMDFSPRKL